MSLRARTDTERRQAWRRALIAVLLTLLLNAGLFTLLYVQAEKALPDLRVKHPMEVSLLREEPDEVKELEGQVVDLEPPEQEEIPKESRYLSQFNTRVDKEQKARPSPGARKQRKPRPKVAERPTRPSPEEPAERTVNKKSILFKRPGPRPLRPSSSAAEMADASMQLANADVFVSDDALLDVTNTGDRTLLNSRRFRYWDFFHRVRERVREHWRPNDAYRRRDPTWSVYQRQNRLTVLRVVLDDEGRITTLSKSRKSGLEFLDDEAVRAFAASGPFENPPKGLADDTGRIVFTFGFYLDTDGGIF